MKTYEYKGYNQAGHSCKGLVEALSIKNAREKLSVDGVFAEKVALTGRRLKFSAEQRAITYRELSVLLAAGITIEGALDVLIKSPEMTDSHILLASVRDRIRDGASLATALFEACSSMSSFERAIIESAEKSATVEVMLERLADFVEEQEKIRGNIISAMVYPAVVLFVAVIIAFVMLGVLIPRMQEFLSDNNVEMPAITVMIITLGRFLARWSVPIIVLLGGMIAYIVRRLRSDPDFRVHWDMRMFSIPLWGRGYAILANLRFSQTMSILMSGGISLIDGFVLSGRSTGSEWIMMLTDKEVESIRNGGSLSDAVRRIPPLSRFLPGWIQTGEASGELVALLASAGKRYQEQWNRYTKRCLSLLEPLLILFVGGFALMVILSVLLPIIRITQSVGR